MAWVPMLVPSDAEVPPVFATPPVEILLLLPAMFVMPPV